MNIRISRNGAKATCRVLSRVISAILRETEQGVTMDEEGLKIFHLTEYEVKEAGKFLINLDKQLNKD